MIILIRGFYQGKHSYMPVKSRRKHTNNRDRHNSNKRTRFPGTAQTKRWARKLNILTWILLVWSFLFADPASNIYKPFIVLLILMPWLALIIVARTPGNFSSLIGTRNSASGKTEVDLSFVMPGLLLFCQFSMNFSLLRWSGIPAIHLTALGCAVLLGASALWTIRNISEKKIEKVLLLLLMLPYGYGTILATNALLDRSSPQIFESVVLSKRISNGYRSRIPELDIGPWGPQTEETRNIFVGYRLYEAMNPGDRICAYLKTGALGAPWYWIAPCSQTAQNPS